MIYNSAILHRLKDFNLADDEVAEKLKEFQFIPCKPYEETRTGWVSPFGEHSDYLNPGALNGFMICLKIESRKVPSSTINQILADRIADIKRKDPNAKINGGYRKQLKEDIRMELQPRAFSKIDKIHAYIDRDNSTLVINTSSKNKAESFVSALKFALNGVPNSQFKVQRVKTNFEPSAIMTQWLLSNTTPPKLTTMETATIRNTDTGTGTIKYNKQDLDDSRLKGYLEEKKTVADLSVSYSDKAIFTLTEDFIIKGIKWADNVFSSEGESNEDSLEGQITGDFVIMRKQLNELISHLVDECLGGEAISDEE